MIAVSCDYCIYTAADCGRYHDGIFVVIILISDGILTIYSEGIEQFKQCQELCYDSAAFRIYIILIFELFSAKVVDVCNLLRSDAADDLFVRNRKEDFLPGFAPRLPVLENIDNDISVC